jgi:hypothetical protein
VGARIPGPEGRSQGIEGIRFQRFAEDYPRGLLVMLSVSRMAVGTLTVNRAEVLQGVCAVEGSSASERVAALRSNNDRDQVRDGIRVDVEREHQPVCDSASGCESI